MVVLEGHELCKTFRIPEIHRRTVREHVLGFFWPVHYRTEYVLKNVSLTLNRGETLGIMGRNGSGKSTLLKILAGIYQPNAGKVVRHAPLTSILELGVGWNPELDAIDNICLIGTAMGMTLKSLRTATEEILDFAELHGFENLELKHYSSGMSSRLAYAVAFRAVRETLLLDEIFAVGDVGFRAKCQQRFRELHRAGHSVILVSHNPLDVAEFCQHAILLEHGQIFRQGTGAEVADAYKALLERTP